MTGTPQPTESEPDPEIGRTIDERYKIVAPLGVGGMGAVYKAEHLGMGKQVAVKVLHAHVSARRDAGSRFRREAYAGGKIDHPNCVQVSDFGVREDGSFYLVMELLVGESLRDAMDRDGKIPWPRALGVARHVLRGLAYAHGQGVVHRDIKPENVFLCRHDDDPEFAKILDFGIAKLIGASAAEQSTVTQAGMTVGTPTYLSPEQAFGGTIGPPSDLYSLSVVLYEMIAGRPPFEDEEPVKLLSAHATREVPRFAPELAVPPAVEELVRRGLAKTTDARFANADDYVMEIDRVRAELIPGFVRAATLAPFPALADHSGPYARAMTPLPLPTASAMHALPKRKLSIGWIVAAILTVGVIAAIAAGGRGSSSPSSGSAPAGGVVPVPMPMPSVMPSADDKELKLKAALHDLESGATCADRKEAVAVLRDLGDPRAIPALKKARYRGRGGVLGIGESNTNACLAADAKAAITALGGK